ncbi:transposase [Streptomyces sp. NBC_00268]
MREWLPDDHVVWVLLEVVDHLDLSGLEKRYSLGGVGRRAYDPRMMLALLIYAYADGIRSSRQIERLCRTDVAMRVICALQVPDHTAIARFRQMHQGSVRELFTQVLLICAKAGLGRLGTIAIDGTKVAANASRAASCRRAWLQEQVDSITAEAAAVDETEDAAFGTANRSAETPRQLRCRQDRNERIRRCLEEVKAEEAARGRISSRSRPEPRPAWNGRGRAAAEVVRCRPRRTGWPWPPPELRLPGSICTRHRPASGSGSRRSASSSGWPRPARVPSRTSACSASTRPRAKRSRAPGSGWPGRSRP